MLDIKDVVELDNKKSYIVVSKMVHTDNKLYYYLVELEGDDVMFCYENQGKLVEITDQDLNTELLTLFMEEELRNMEKE